MRGISETFLIYIVDDDDAVRDSLVALLESEGFVVRPFSSADGFLDDLDENPSGYRGESCLLLDLNMPGKGGMELLSDLAKRDNALPVVVMTGNIDENTRTQALKRGATAFLEKPSDSVQLVGALKNALAN
jgi:FixJ family two-component response regulator